MLVSTLLSDALSAKANILIDENHHACLADFGLLTIISDPAIFTNSSSIVTCGTIRWMSPELLCPSNFDLKDSRPTKESDRYALGMVTYEVLNGKAPFAASPDFIVTRKVIEGERPERPEGVQGLWFTGDLWGMLKRCWATRSKDRPSIEAVFECLEQVSKAWRPPPEQFDEDLEKEEDDWDLTEIILPVWFFVSAPFTSRSCGGFCTDYASDPLLGLTSLGGWDSVVMSMWKAHEHKWKS